MRSCRSHGLKIHGLRAMDGTQVCRLRKLLDFLLKYVFGTPQNDPFFIKSQWAWAHGPNGPGPMGPMGMGPWAQCGVYT